MTAELPVLDPVIEEILREIAANPDSTLLRVPRRNVVPYLLTERPDRFEQTGTSAAERELVRAHRNEVAWLLRQVCLRFLLDGPERRTVVSPFDSTGQRSELPTTSDVEDCVRRAGARTREQPELEAPLALLLSTIGASSAERPAVSVLAAAAHRLEPRNQTRNIAAFDFLQRNDFRSTIQLCSDVLRDRPLATDLERACEGLAFAFAQTDQPLRALDSYRFAAAHSDGGVTLHGNHFVLALRLCMKDEAIKAGRMLGDLLSAQHAFIDWYSKHLRDGRRAGMWTPSADSVKLARTCEDLVGPAAGRISDAFA